MFTGIVETQGIIKDIRESGLNKVFWIKSGISSKLKVDQSISHDGVCLTVEDVKAGRHKVTAVAETLQKTNLKFWKKGTAVNLERSLKLSSRLDGHLVQGHADTTGTCIFKKETGGSWVYTIGFEEKFAPLVIEKGSVAVNGISLTAFNVTSRSFDITVIPYTYDNTNIQLVEEGTAVNLEFDMIGKYISRKLSLKGE